MHSLRNRLAARVGSIRGKVISSRRSRTSAPASFGELSAKLSNARERIRQSRPAYRA